MTGQQAPDPAQNPENLGQQQLAANLVQLAEQQDSQQVSEYFNDLLSDTEQKAPAERAAAFEYLAQEQTVQIRKDLLDAGENTVQELARSTERRGGDVQTESRRARGKLAEIEETQRREVGRHVREFNQRGLIRGHDQVVGMINQGYTRTARSSRERLHEWRMDQTRLTDQFGSAFGKAASHERALTEATEIVNPEHQAEQKDLSPLIEKSVEKIAAQKIITTVTEAGAKGISPEEAVLALLETTPDTISKDTLKTVASAIHGHQDAVYGSARRAEHASEEAELTFKRFANSGQDEYGYARSPQQAEEAFRTQNHKLRRAIETAGDSAKLSVLAIQDAQAQLHRLGQFIATKKQPAHQ